MAESDFYRKQAAKCLRLSRNCYDMETSRQLRQMANEFIERADAHETEHESDGAFMPGGHNGSGANGNGGNMDRG